MISLRDLQTSFVAALREPQEDAVTAHIIADGIHPARRIAIYRNNLREGFLKTLDAMFPIVRALGGEDWFRQTARAYLDAHPSTSGNLHHIGVGFESFLEQILQGSDFDYFIDVAKLEWAYQESLVAADHCDFDSDALAQVARHTYASLTFVPHPAVRLVRSAYPLLAIWKAHQPGAENTTIDLNAGASNVLISRRDDHVELREIDDAAAMMLDAFANGSTLADVAGSLLRDRADCDLGALLQLLVKLKTLVDFKKVS